MLNIPTPAELAERNRPTEKEGARLDKLQREASDDALLAEWLPKTAAHLIQNYRGGWMVYRICQKKGDRVYYPARFVEAVNRALAGTGWAVELYKSEKFWGGPVYRILFMPSEDVRPIPMEEYGASCGEG